MTDSAPPDRSIDSTEDPVCGMVVDLDEADARGLKVTHHGREYVFCGKGCMLEFRDDPERYLRADYQPSM
jgi:YHS domain-containing protein